MLEVSLIPCFGKGVVHVEEEVFLTFVPLGSGSRTSRDETQLLLSSGVEGAAFVPDYSQQN